MGDDKDGAPDAESFHDPHDVFFRLYIDRACRLIQDEKAGPPVQQFQNFDALLLADRELPHRAAGFDQQLVVLRQLRVRLVHLASGQLGAGKGPILT